MMEMEKIAGVSLPCGGAYWTQTIYKSYFFLLTSWGTSTAELKQIDKASSMSKGHILRLLDTMRVEPETSFSRLSFLFRFFLQGHVQDYLSHEPLVQKSEPIILEAGSKMRKCFSAHVFIHLHRRPLGLIRQRCTLALATSITKTVASAKRPSWIPPLLLPSRIPLATLAYLFLTQ